MDEAEFTRMALDEGLHEKSFHDHGVGADVGQAVVFWVAERQVRGCKGGFFAGGVDGNYVGWEWGSKKERKELCCEAHPRIIK